MACAESGVILKDFATILEPVKMCPRVPKEISIGIPKWDAWVSQTLVHIDHE